VIGQKSWMMTSATPWLAIPAVAGLSGIYAQIMRIHVDNLNYKNVKSPFVLDFEQKL